MPVSTLSNEHYETLLRDVSLVVGGAVIQLINLNKKFLAIIFWPIWLTRLSMRPISSALPPCARRLR